MPAQSGEPHTPEASRCQGSTVPGIRRVVAQQVVQLLRAAQRVGRAGQFVDVAGVLVHDVRHPAPGVHATVAAEVAGAGAETRPACQCRQTCATRCRSAADCSHIASGEPLRAPSPRPGSNNAARMPMMPITTNNSINVKASRLFFFWSLRRRHNSNSSSSKSGSSSRDHRKYGFSHTLRSPESSRTCVLTSPPFLPACRSSTVSAVDDTQPISRRAARR